MSTVWYKIEAAHFDSQTIAPKLDTYPAVPSTEAITLLLKTNTQYSYSSKLKVFFWDAFKLKLWKHSVSYFL